MPIGNRIANKLAGLANFLNYAGGLIDVNAILSSLAVYWMTWLDLPETIKLQIGKLLRHCLWRSSNMEDKRPAMVAWTTVCRPENQGGLGVLNINIQNYALLLKNLHKFFNRNNIPWVNLIWDTYYKNG